MSRLQKLIAAFIVLAVVLFLAAPLLLSSTFVKSRIEAQLAQLTGREVLLAGDSSLSIYPYLGVTYGRFTIEQRDVATPLMLADGIEARMSLISILTGKPQVNEITLLKPRLYLERNTDGLGNWRRSDRLPKSQTSLGKSFRIQTIKIKDGTIAYRDRRTDVSREIRTVNGSVVWPGEIAPLEATFSAQWLGKPFSMTTSIGDPVALASEEESGLKFKLTAELLEIAFTGKVDRRGGRSFGGAFRVTSPNLGKAAAWLDQPVGLASALEAMELSGTLSADSGKMAMNDAKLNLGDQKAFGRLQFKQDEDRKLTIGGTLAFDSIQLPDPAALVAAAAANPDTNVAALLNTNFDLRISAEKAKFGPLNLSNLAATAPLSDGSATFDIGQAEALDGLVSGTLSLHQDKLAGAEIKVSVRDIALEQLSELNGDGPIKLQGKGNAKLLLRFIPGGAGLMQNLNGEGSIEGEDGMIAGINLGTIATATKSPQSLTSENVFRSTTPYETLKVSFNIADGVMFFKDSELKSSTFASQIQGRADLVSKSVALSGVVFQQKPSPENSEVQRVLTVPFFIGGTIVKPLFVGLPSYRRDNDNFKMPEPTGDQ